jgi:hypothetical protein
MMTHYYTFLKKPIRNTLKAFYPLGFLSKKLPFGIFWRKSLRVEIHKSYPPLTFLAIIFEKT